MQHNRSGKLCICERHLLCSVLVVWK